VRGDTRKLLKAKDPEVEVEEEHEVGGQWMDASRVRTERSLDHDAPARCMCSPGMLVPN